MHSAVLNATRCDPGWHALRIHGLLAAGFLPIVLLLEYGKHYARLDQPCAELNAAHASPDLAAVKAVAPGRKP